MGLFSKPTREEELKYYNDELSKYDPELVYKNNLISLYNSWNNSAIRTFDITEALMLHYDLQELISVIKRTNGNSNLDEIAKLKSLLDSGAITQEEFEAKKKQLLGL